MKRSALKPAKTSALAVRSQPLLSVCLTGGVDQFVEHIGGKKNFIDMCRWSRSPSVKELVRQWDSLAGDEQETTLIGDLCRRVGLDPHQLTQEAVASFSAMQSMIAQMKLAMALPSVMDASIQAALRPEGGRERELHFMMAGFLARE